MSLKYFYWQHLNFLVDTRFPLFFFFKPPVVLSDLNTGLSWHTAADFFKLGLEWAISEMQKSPELEIVKPQPACQV